MRQSTEVTTKKMIRVDKIEYDVYNGGYVMRLCSYFSNPDGIEDQCNCYLIYFSGTKRGYLSSPFHEEYEEMNESAKKEYINELENMFDIRISHII